MASNFWHFLYIMWICLYVFLLLNQNYHFYPRTMSTVVTQQVDEVKSTPWSGGRSPFNVEYGKMMMWLFLLSDALTFSSLLISYGALRFSAPTWPAPSEVFQSFPGVIESGAPLVFVGLMTLILILSSVTMV